MVGAICCLYDLMAQNDKIGLITFEGLSENTLESQKDKSINSDRGYIAIPLRNALMIKLQKNHLVPPYKELLKLTDVEKYEIKNESDEPKQYGVISFVNASNTSQYCPICKAKNEEVNHPNIFKCCGINLKDWNHTPNMSDKDKELYASMDVNDKVAAFNIARRVFKII